MTRQEKAAVLVVDDAAENIAILKGILEDEYLVRPATSGRTALQIATGARPPEIILLDVLMPEMDGYQTLQHLQAHPQSRDIPVIFVTALGDTGAEVRGLALGAVDYLTKPLNAAVVKARLRTHLALRRTSAELARRQQALIAERETIEDIICRMRAARDFSDRQLRYRLSSLERSNGDLLLAAFTANGAQRLLVGDVTGHGLSAALAAPLVSHVFYHSCRENTALEACIALLNQVMCRQLPVNIFMVACLLEIAPDRASAQLWNAGLPAGLWLQQRDGQAEISEFPARSLPLGISESIAWGAEKYLFQPQPGDRLYFFTDGVSETAAASGELFGVAGVKQFLRSQPAPASLDALMQTLASFGGAEKQGDDITFVELLC